MRFKIYSNLFVKGFRDLIRFLGNIERFVFIFYFYLRLMVLLYKLLLLLKMRYESSIEELFVFCF